MGWFSRKNNAEVTDRILDLDDIVSPGANRYQGADAGAQQAEAPSTTDQDTPQEASIEMVADAVEAVLASDNGAGAHAHAGAPAPDLAPDPHIKFVVQQIVREELTTWLEQNMGQIIADSLPPPKKRPKRGSKKTATKKTAKKSVRKTALKKKKTPAAKTRSPAKKKTAITRKAAATANNEKVIPLKRRNKSS